MRSEDDVRPANQIGVVHEGPQPGDSVWTDNPGSVVGFRGTDVFNYPLGHERGPSLNHDAFFFDDIQSRSSHDPLIERLYERIGVDQAASRSVDDQHAGTAF